MSPISEEPQPRSGIPVLRRGDYSGLPVREFPTPQPLPETRFRDVLNARRSAVSGHLPEQQLGDLLFHVFQRRRGGDGRFGQPWEGRASPSAGGLHVISVLCIPIECHASLGIYDRECHGIRMLGESEHLRERNAESVELLTSAKGGTTLQLMADTRTLSACYENSLTLLWRDSGALAATICLVATCLGITSVILGRTGESLPIGRSLDGLQAVGAVHLGAPF